MTIRTVPITVGVCSRNRPEKLRRSLGALLAQDPAPAEILVVDNAPSSDDTRRLVVDEMKGVTYTLEPAPGLNFARNRALRVASHDVVAYCDDDAVVEAGWCEAIARTLQEDVRIGICTGRVVALTLDTPGARLFEAIGGFDMGASRLRIGAHRHGQRPLIAWSFALGAGCSLAIRRSLALELGGFDEALDFKPLVPGSGDLDIIWRVLDAGYDVVYEPCALARHEHRDTEDGVLEQLREYHRSNITFLEKSARNARGGRRLMVTTFLAWRLMKPAFRMVRSAVGGDHFGPSTLAGFLQESWRGLGVYDGARREAARRRLDAPL
jgi:glycosyltransferase involved in cell wall biosynthesis